MNVGEKLKKRRTTLNLTQDKVGEELGVTRQTISNWENGKSYPDIERIISLSELYELSLDELLKGDLDMVNHLHKNTKNNRYLKFFIGLLLLNVFLMGILIVGDPINKIVLGTLITLIALNVLYMFYLIIKKI